MTVYVLRNGQLVEKRHAPPRRRIQLVSDTVAYTCPITDRPIEGRYAHRENLKRHDCRILETGESRDCPKNVQRSYDEGLSRILDRAL